LDADGNPILNAQGNPTTRPARGWHDYPVEKVRELLLYHIVEGEYSYHNLSPDNTVVRSLATDESANMLYLSILNNRDAKIRVNDFPGTIQALSARTGNLKATNGFIHVFDAYQRYGVQ